MGRIVQKQVILKNHIDEILADASVLPAEKVRQVTLDMIIDTGAFLVSLPQSLVDRLGLPLLREDEATLADLNKVKVNIYRDLAVYINDRQTVVECIAKPKSPYLLGVLVLEHINYVVDPLGGKIMPNPSATPGMIGFEEF